MARARRRIATVSIVPAVAGDLAAVGPNCYGLPNYVEGVAMFGALAYVGAHLHQRFGLSLGVVVRGLLQQS